MAAPDKPDRQSGWLTITELANAMDCTYGYCRREIVRCAAEEDIKMVGRRKMIKARPTIERYLSGRLKPIADPDFETFLFFPEPPDRS